MGLLDFMAGKRKPEPFDAVAAEARVKTLEAILPSGTRVSLMEPSKGFHLTYHVQSVGDRSGMSAMLVSIVEVVSTTEERWSVSLEVLDTEDESSAYSSVELPDTEVRFVDVLTRAHDDLYARIPSQTIRMDAEDGSFTISDVPRGRAVATAQTAVRTWEAILRETDGRWRDSSLSVDVGVGIGVDGDHAEITYGTTVEREPDPMGYRKTATGSERVSDAEWAQRVFTAWNDNLPLLEAMLRLPVPADHAAELSFSADSLEPRLSVTHHETYESDQDAAKALVASIRSQVPYTELMTG